MATTVRKSRPRDADSLMNSPAVTLANANVSLANILSNMRQEGVLGRWLRRAAIEEFLIQHAKQENLSVSNEELQREADTCRGRHGLASALDTRRWLSKNHLTEIDFENMLERRLLIRKLKQLICGAQLEPHYQRNPQRYQRVRMRVMSLSRLDLAEEIACQLREELADFVSLACRFSFDPSLAVTPRIQHRSTLDTKLACELFGASANSIVGPVPSPTGFQLYLVEEILEPAFDEATKALLLKELFASWLAQELGDKHFSFPLLDRL